jgi:ABC-type transport system involved in multi-copper enzyme maturation permease subunit
MKDIPKAVVPPGVEQSKGGPMPASVHPSFLLHPSERGLLHYRPWRGSLASSSGTGMLVFLAVQGWLLVLLALTDSYPVVRLLLAGLFVGLWGLVVRSRAWPVARVSLALLFRRRLFWALYGLALLVFLMFFFGQYLLPWAIAQVEDANMLVFIKPLVERLGKALNLNGSALMFRNFFGFEGYNVMIVLALAGSMVVGNDLRFGSLPFYLSKPISRWDYLLGKGLAVAVFVNLLTTLPAVVLWVEYGLVDDWSYFTNNAHLLAGVLGYGVLLTMCLTVILLATATWLRRTVPLIMTWTALFFFCRILAGALVDGLHMDARWRLIDLWNSTAILGSRLLTIPQHRLRPFPQPEWYEAALVLAVVCGACVAYLVTRLRAVEIVK